MAQTPVRREHQIRALAKLAGHYGGGGRRAQLYWACGTGKTYLGRWLAEDLGAGITVVLMPSLALVAQTLAAWQESGNTPFTPMVVCSDQSAADAWRVDADWWAEHGVQITTDSTPVTAFLRGQGPLPRVVFSTYHSAPVVGQALRAAGARAGLLICDEAHHVTEQRNRFVLDDAEFPADRRLFATATPVAGGGVSMVDERLFGPVVDKLDFAEAIERGLLVDYEVLILDATAGEKPVDGVIVPAAVAAAAGRGARRIISFHSRVDTARRFAAAIDGLILPGALTVRAAAVAGADPSSVRRAALAQLAEVGYPGVTLVSNARCLAEGIDVPGVDAVLFGDPKKSPTEVTQALSRALRAAPGKTRALIVIPVVLQKGAAVDDELFSGRFAAVWGVLRALRSLDSRMATVLDRVRRVRGDAQSPGAGGGEGPVPVVTFDVDGLDLSMFAAYIVDVAETNQAVWDAHLTVLRAWAKQHGHTAVPVAAQVGGRWIGRWVNAQRRIYAAGGMSPERATALLGVPGWAWTFSGAWWHADVAVVTAVAGRWLDLEDPDVVDTKLGHRPGKTSISVGRWCAQQRRYYRDVLLEDWQIDMCEAIPGWSWTAGVPEADLRMLDALFWYVDAHGHPNAGDDETIGQRPVGKFVTSIRRRRFMGRLLLALKMDVLAVTLGRTTTNAFEWRSDDTRFELNLLALHQFVRRTGGLAIPEHHVEVFHGWPSNLYDWCRGNRHLRRHGNLDISRQRLLERVPGWEWERTRATRVRVDIGMRSHGSRAGYAAGCTCDDCTAANRAYNVEREQLAAAGQATTDRVDAAGVRAHLRILEGAMCHPRARTAMQVVTGLNKKTIDEVINGTRMRVTGWVHETLMNLTVEMLRAHIEANPHDNDPVPAGPTWALVDDMVARGWPKAWISREIGGAGKALQLRGASGGSVFRRNADAIAGLHARLGNRRLPAGRLRKVAVPTLAEIIAAEQGQTAAA